MGTEEREWIDVANDLLLKCHIHLKVKGLAECDANMFVALYEAILGEKVPDFIPASKSQENNAHNVQAIIDSLALDYLQVSLSHITGENIVKGEKESIKNLLEIFDGLLEYLTEQISEASSQTGDYVDQVSKDVHESALQMEPGRRQKEYVPVLKAPSAVGSSSQSSDILIPSWEIEGSESTAELIKLGDTAHTFTLRKSAPESERTISLKDERPVSTRTKGQDDDVSSKASSPISSHRREVAREQQKLDDHVCSNGLPDDYLKSRAQMYGEPIRSAIPLQPPYQPTEPRPDALKGRTGSHQSSPGLSQTFTRDQRPAEPAGSQHASMFTEPFRPLSRMIPVDASQAPVYGPQSSLLQGPSNGEETFISRPTKKAEHRASQQLEQNGTTAAETHSSAVQKKVAFRTLPDIRFMTLRSDVEEKEGWQSVGEDEETTLEESQTLPSFDEQQPRTGSESSLLPSRVYRKDDTTSFTEEPLSRRRAMNKLSEQELHEMSENLSRKLNELDLMLKKALSEGSREDFREEDKLSQHSDSFMEYRRKKHQPGTAHRRKPHSRPRSLSSSPPPAPPSSRYTLHTQFEDALNKDAKDQMKSIRREIQNELDQQRIKAKFVTKAYEEEVKCYEDNERIKISKLKEKLREKEEDYKENLFKDLQKTPQPAKVYSRKTTPQKPKQSQWISSGVAKPRKATPMKIKDNDLLPLLLDEFPYLHISPHTLNKMWKHQFAQMEQLTKSASEEDRSRAKLQNEVEVAQKKHDLLVEIIRKEQGHNHRLQEFKDRIRHQKSAQNKMREKRQQIARAKKYYEDYHVQLRAKMMRAKTREERIFKNLFEEGLEIQKDRLRDVRLYTKEKREEQKKRHKDELESMENYYKDKFSMLAEAVSQERHEIKAREKAQENTLHKMKRGLRSKMEKEIRELQDIITKNDDDAFFRELEAERLKRRLQMASFQYSKSHLL